MGNFRATKKIKSITSVIHATTGTAGSYGFTCAKRLASVNMGQINVGASYDFAGLRFPKVPAIGDQVPFVFLPFPSTAIMLLNW